MQPTLRSGDVVVLDATARSPRPGEVWVALSGRHPIVHRVVTVRGGLAALQGDANPRPDPPIPVSRLIARAVASERADSSGRIARVAIDRPGARFRVTAMRTLRQLARPVRAAAGTARVALRKVAAS